jgi:hypothetical protein
MYRGHPVWGTLEAASNAADGGTQASLAPPSAAVRQPAARDRFTHQGGVMDQIEDFVEYAEGLELDSADLDPAVHDCAQEAGLGTLNSLADAAEQEDHIGAVEADASAVNNGGLEAQIAFLLEHDSAEEVQALLHHLARDLSAAPHAPDAGP